MIVLEITVDSGVSLYVVLGLTREGVKAGRDATGDVRNAAKKKRKLAYLIIEPHEGPDVILEVHSYTPFELRGALSPVLKLFEGGD